MEKAGGFNPVDSSGFIAIESLRLKAYASQHRWFD